VSNYVAGSLPASGVIDVLVKFDVEPAGGIPGLGEDGRVK
jgi:hypothetical protein